MTHIYSYNAYSESAKELASALGVKRIKHENSRFVGNRNKCVINWGSSTIPDEVLKCRQINPEYLIAIVSNKLRFFKDVNGECSEFIVPWTEDGAVVAQWLGEGHAVVARKTLTGHSGAGIEIIEGVGTEIPEAPLYTLYKKKKDEYRLHMFRSSTGEPTVFDVQRKARDVDNPNPNWKVRNHANGFIFVRGDVAPPLCVREASKKVFLATGLDFGAIDVIYNEHEDKAYVLEINSAPGLTGTTLENYVRMFKENFAV